MGKEGFKELRVWQKGKDLAVFLYGITHTGLFSKDQALRDQMRRAALSIPSNIAEGDQLDTDKQAVRHFYFAKGSPPSFYLMPLSLLRLVILIRRHLRSLKQDASRYPAC